MQLTLTIQSENSNINSILQNQLKISSRLLNKLVKNKRVYLNNCICDTRLIPNIGDIITVDFNYEEDNSNILAKKMDLDIVYEDEWLLIVNKPAGIAVHPSILHYSDSLCNGIKFYFDSINLHKKIRPVNRLDLNTSGLVLFAKCEYIQECLILQMQNNSFKKTYLAICNDLFENKYGSINLPIARKPGSIIERCIDSSGQPSITHYTVLKEFKSYSLVKCVLETGRTHQIRLHMSSINHPLLGDSLYGCSSDLIKRQALHCWLLEFVHPVSNKGLSFSSKLPMDFADLLDDSSSYLL